MASRMSPASSRAGPACAGFSGGADSATWKPRSAGAAPSAWIDTTASAPAAAAGPTALVHARPDPVVVGCGSSTTRTPAAASRAATRRGHVEGEGVLRVAGVGGGAGGVARLRAAATVRDRAVDRRRLGGVAAVVPGDRARPPVRRPRHRSGAATTAAVSGGRGSRGAAGRRRSRTATERRRRSGTARTGDTVQQHRPTATGGSQRTAHPATASLAREPAAPGRAGRRHARRRWCNRVSPTCR